MTEHQESAAELVLSERHGPVLLLTFNRPDRLNAWNNELEDAYFARLDEADADPEIRAVVVTGAGRGFCAGADMDELRRAGERGRSPGPADGVPRRRPRTYPLSFRKPLIAAINGAAAGLGLVEALFCDVRFCVPKAKLTTAFARRGLIAEYGSAWLLPRLVGPSRAKDLLMSGRVVLGEQAQAMGLVDELAEPEELLPTALAYARDLAENCSPTSLAVIKQQIDRALDTDLGDALDEAQRELIASFGRADVAEGVASYLEGRPPAFPPLSG